MGIFLSGRLYMMYNLITSNYWIIWDIQKQPLKGVLRKGVLKVCSEFTGEHPCQSAISIKLICNFMEITLRHGCSPVFFLRTPLGGRFCWRHYDCLVFLFRHNFHFEQFLQVIFKRNPSKSCPLVSCYIQFFSCSEELFVLLSEAATRGVL